jgi:hypothetical protein
MSSKDLRTWRISVQSGNFAASLANLGLASSRVAAGQDRYRAGREALARYERAVAFIYDDFGWNIRKRMNLNPLSRRVYGLARRYAGDRFWIPLAQCVCDRLIEGATWTEVLSVVEQGMRTLGQPFNLPEARKLREMVEPRMAQVRAGRRSAGE